MFQLSLYIYFLAAFLAIVFAAPARHGAHVGGIGAPISNPNAKNIIANRYIVVYKNATTNEQVANHQAQVMTKMRKRSLSARPTTGRPFSNKMDTFSMMGWRGMSLDAEDGMIIDIAAASEVSTLPAWKCALVN